MFMLTISDPTLTTALIKGQRARSEAMARGFHLTLRAPGRLFAAVAETARAVAVWLRRRKRNRAAAATLRGLNDHLLSDIGIGRSEILAAARSGARDPEDYRAVLQAHRRDGRGPARRQTPSTWREAA